MNNRQNGRRRGRGGNNNGRGGNPGRPDSGNRIDNRARGNANQLYEKYKNLARDAQMSGDRVNTEYYLQFADHYFRVLSETRARFEEQNPGAPQQRRIQPVDSFDDFDDGDDYADEGEPIRAGEQGEAPRQNGYNGGQNGSQNGGGQNGYRQQPRYDNRRDRDDNRGEQRGNDRGNDTRGNESRVDTRNDRYEGQRRNREEAPREDMRATAAAEPPVLVDAEEEARRGMTGSPIANDLGEDSPDGSEPTPIEGRRRGRPRRVAEPAPAAAEPAVMEADRLPPSLSLVGGSPEASGEEEAPRPRRRRRAAPVETPAE